MLAIGSRGERRVSGPVRGMHAPEEARGATRESIRKLFSVNLNLQAADPPSDQVVEDRSYGRSDASQNAIADWKNDDSPHAQTEAEEPRCSQVVR